MNEQFVIDLPILAELDEKPCTATRREPLKKPKEVPIWEKSNLTLEEAAVYFSIGINKLRELTNDDNCTFVLWCGSKRLIKRRLLEEYLEKVFSI